VNGGEQWRGANIGDSVAGKGWRGKGGD
jgi:hypothetical protein